MSSSVPTGKTICTTCQGSGANNPCQLCNSTGLMDTWCLDCRGSLRLDNYNNVNGTHNGLRMGKKMCSANCEDGYVKARCSNCEGKGATGFCGDCKGRGWVEPTGIEGSDDGWIHVDRWVTHNGVSGHGSIEDGVRNMTIGNDIDDEGVWVGGFVTGENTGWAN